MTTAMLMCAVVMAVGRDDRKLVAVSCVNTVVAANAGGAFCLFGDITTLMVWQKGILDFWAFFSLFVPSVSFDGVTVTPPLVQFTETDENPTAKC